MTQKKITIYYEQSGEKLTTAREVHLKLEELQIGVLSVEIRDVETQELESVSE